MVPALQNKNINTDVIESQATMKAEFCTHEAEESSIGTNDHSLEKILTPYEGKTAVMSAENDSITVTTESSISPDTIVALGGKDAANDFVESFAASFAEKYTTEFLQQLAQMKKAKAVVSNENVVVDDPEELLASDGLKEEAGCAQLEKPLPERKPSVPAPELAEMIYTESAESINQEPVQERRHGDPLVKEESAQKTQPIQSRRSSKDEQKRARSSSSSSQISSTSASSSTSKRSDDVKSEYEAKEALVEEMKVQIWKIDDIFDEASRERVFVTHDSIKRPTAKDEELSSEKYSKWILILRRVFENDNKTLRKTMLDIQSPFIRDIIHDIVKEERAMLLSKNSIDWPNDNVFRYRKGIQDAAIEKGELAVKHVGVLLKLIDTEYSTRIKDIENMFAKRTSSFEILREAFWPGDIVVKGMSDNPRAFRLVEAFYKVKRSFGGGPDEVTLIVKTEYIDFSGHEFGTVSEKFRVPEYPGINFISELDVFPLKYHPNKEVVERNLIARGRIFAALKGQNHRVYNGPVDEVDTYRRPGRYSSPADSNESSEISSDIIIDTVTFNRFNASKSISVSNISDELNDGELTEDHLMICTNQIPFYSLQDKKFHKGSIENIEDKIFNEKVFSQLVLPEPTKELVRVLVRNHKRGRDFDDFIKGKGKGLVLLLHGPPGVGKTMTAEAVAEYTHRPLYVVTCGELGTTAESLEASLERVLDISNAFGAVLLLDEADIFLEQRTTSDLQRNALVSIFLRLLEYYKGILFLTTNRIRTFDDAFHSRIHVTLAYSNHDAVTREQIWRNFGAHMAPGLGIEDDDYKELATWELNGRQIKNVIGSCKALAVDRGDQINITDLRTVLQTSIISGSKGIGQYTQ
ncbi:uncharacterized protein EAE98_007001 [Botrytis deweyae]|uniref:AAA+ ATPase domain-containing protein n=1 Tax=Botrytis deweyae TaxID=2478750 RepID=A0ABQ7IJB7_9HELO|nr:uncharacterized protein EAE98_007001 [Botrytis deweyae]KAF7925776.1 hypothetical protein EAE98_007001 [Botrytis deweyae]